MSLPGTTENVQWGADLVFKVGPKMFTVACLDPGDPKVSFKCTPEEFAELVEQDGIKPADYVARYHWVTMMRWDALPDREVRRLVKDSYDIVRTRMPLSKLAAFAPQPPVARKRTAKTTRRVKTKSRKVKASRNSVRASARKAPASRAKRRS